MPVRIKRRSAALPELTFSSGRRRATWAPRVRGETAGGFGAAAGGVGAADDQGTTLTVAGSVSRSRNSIPGLHGVS